MAVNKRAANRFQQVEFFSRCRHCGQRNLGWGKFKDGRMLLCVAENRKTGIYVDKHQIHNCPPGAVGAPTKGTE